MRGVKLQNIPLLLKHLKTRAKIGLEAHQARNPNLVLRFYRFERCHLVDLAAHPGVVFPPLLFASEEVGFEIRKYIDQLQAKAVGQLPLVANRFREMIGGIDKMDLLVRPDPAQEVKQKKPNAFQRMK